MARRRFMAKYPLDRPVEKIFFRDRRYDRTIDDLVREVRRLEEENKLLQKALEEADRLTEGLA